MEDDGDGDVLNTIRQYQNSIVKHSELGNDAKILNYISKLYEMPITVAHLTDTGIGRTVNSLRKYSGDVGNASRAIVSKWKHMVSKEEDEEITTATEQYSPAPSSSSEKKKSSSHKSDSKHSKSQVKHKSESEQSKHSKRSEPSDSKSSVEEHRTKSHRKEEKKDSYHTSDKHSKTHKSDSRRQKDKDDKKRKHKEAISASDSKKKRYSSESSDSEQVRVNGVESQSDDIETLSPSSQITGSSEETRENTQSPIDFVKASTASNSNKSSSNHHKKHRNHEKEKLTNGKSSHKEKEAKPVKEKELPEKSKPTSKTSEPQEKKRSPSKSKKGLALNQDNGIDSGSGASFAEALGMMGPRPASTPKITYKKKTSSSPSPTPSTSLPIVSKSHKSQPSVSLVPTTNLLAPNLKLDPLDINITSQLPEITMNYKPNPQHYVTMMQDQLSMNAFKHLTEEEALSVSISSKTQRTKVYSGNKTNWGFVPSLFNICVRVLQDNIEALEYTGGVPYEILKPVLERATPNQLLNTEYYNPYLIEESDELWELHCKKECKGMKRQEMESWRDMYLRIRDERDAKLKALTVNIKQSIDKSLPVRQTKLAYVDSVVKPPRGIARKQAKYGTDKPVVTPTARLSAIASGSGGEKISVPSPSGRSHHTSPAAPIKPKKAPLMLKTLQLIKSRFRR